MIVTVEIPAQTQALIDRHRATAAQAKRAIVDGLRAGVVAGGEAIALAGQRGELGLGVGTHSGGEGMFGSVFGWMIDAEIPLGAIGVPANRPAAVYAAIQNYGGVITPKRARALAVPISAEAKRSTSPRDMADLTFIPRKGRPPLLARLIGRGKSARLQVHWVLVSSVTIRATHWFDRGVELARDEIADGVADALREHVAAWSLQRGGNAAAPSPES